MNEYMYKGPQLITYYVNTYNTILNNIVYNKVLKKTNQKANSVRDAEHCLSRMFSCLYPAPYISTVSLSVG